VVEVLNRLVQQRGAPKYLFADNGSEFTGQLVDLWAYHHGVQIDLSRPGKPTDNAHIETFNGSLRDECLNLHWFETLAEARARLARDLRLSLSSPQSRLPSANRLLTSIEASACGRLPTYSAGTSSPWWMQRSLESTERCFR
jgi:transposase InsO family protein